MLSLYIDVCHLSLITIRSVLLLEIGSFQIVYYTQATYKGICKAKAQLKLLFLIIEYNDCT